MSIRKLLWWCEINGTTPGGINFKLETQPVPCTSGGCMGPLFIYTGWSTSRIVSVPFVLMFQGGWGSLCSACERSEIREGKRWRCSVLALIPRLLTQSIWFLSLCYSGCILRLITVAAEPSPLKACLFHPWIWSGVTETRRMGRPTNRFAECTHVSWLLLLHTLIHSLVGSLANLHGNPMCTIKSWIILFRGGSLGRLMRYYFFLIRCPDAEGHSHFPSCAQQQLVLSRVPSIAALWSVKLLSLWKGYLSA